MSYILDALKKSDQQRQRGATPTLQLAQITAAAPKSSSSIYVGLFAATLLLIGVVIGWLRPWQEIPLSATTLAEPFASPAAIVPLPVPVQTPVSVVSDSVVPQITATPAGEAQQVIPLAQLPPMIQQEIPAMTVQFHAYSKEPGERLVSINSIRLREGGSLMAGLVLEQITEDGMIFSYKGYRFQRGIR